MFSFWAMQLYPLFSYSMQCNNSPFIYFWTLYFFVHSRIHIVTTYEAAANI